MLMNTWQLHLSNWQGMCPVWPISVFFVYTGSLLLTFPQPHKLNLTCYSESSLLVAFCFLFVCMADKTQMCLSSISPLGLFQRFICNIERLKGGTWEPWITGGPDLKCGTSDLLIPCRIFLFFIISM